MDSRIEVGGHEMPMVGFGTAGGIHAAQVKWAYEAGYRLFDSAQAREWYCEECVREGLSLVESAIDRDKVWITSKLHPRDHGYERALRRFQGSLAALGVDYVDAFLLHYPRCWGTLCERSPEGTWKHSWRALEKLHEAELVRVIGVSNFDLNDLVQLVEVAKVQPMLVQNFFDPLHQDREVRAFCQEHGIVYQGYSTLGNQHVEKLGYNPVLTHPDILDIAKRVDQTPSAVVLYWALSRGVAILPRSSQREHIVANTQLDFFVSQDDLGRIDALNEEQPSAPAQCDEPDDLADEQSFEEPLEDLMSVVFWNVAAEDVLVSIDDEVLTTVPPSSTLDWLMKPGQHFVTRLVSAPDEDEFKKTHLVQENKINYSVAADGAMIVTFKNPLDEDDVELVYGGAVVRVLEPGQEWTTETALGRLFFAQTVGEEEQRLLSIERNQPIVLVKPYQEPEGIALD